MFFFCIRAETFVKFPPLKFVTEKDACISICSHKNDIIVKFTHHFDTNDFSYLLFHLATDWGILKIECAHFYA